MRVGCGLRVRRIDGNEYLYFWHYEREGGRSERREDYVGPAREAKSRQEAARKLLVYHRRVAQGLSPPPPPASRRPGFRAAINSCSYSPTRLARPLLVGPPPPRRGMYL